MVWLAGLLLQVRFDYAAQHVFHLASGWAVGLSNVVRVWCAEFASAPNLTAAAAAQNLAWAPISLQSLSLLSYSLVYNASSASALLMLSLSAELGVSGSLTDVISGYSTARRRSLLATNTSEHSTFSSGSLYAFGIKLWCC